MSEQEYSWDVHIFKGEGRYAFQPIIQNEWLRRINADYYRILDENESAYMLGCTTIEMMDYIKNSPRPSVQVKDAPQSERLSKYGVWSKFFKGNLLTAIMYDGNVYSIFSQERRSRRGGGSGYCGQIEYIELPNTATAEELGEAILKAFDAAEKFYSVGKYKPKRQRKTTKTEE